MEKDGGDGSTTLWMHLLPLNYTLKKGQDGIFYVVYFTTKKAGQKEISLTESNMNKSHKLIA